MHRNTLFFEETQFDFLQPSTHRITTPQPSLKFSLEVLNWIQMKIYIQNSHRFSAQELIWRSYFQASFPSYQIIIIWGTVVHFEQIYFLFLFNHLLIPYIKTTHLKSFQQLSLNATNKTRNTLICIMKTQWRTATFKYFTTKRQNLTQGLVMKQSEWNRVKQLIVSSDRFFINFLNKLFY